MTSISGEWLNSNRRKQCPKCNATIHRELMRCICGHWDIWNYWHVSGELPFEAVVPYLFDQDWRALGKTRIKQVICYNNTQYRVRIKGLFSIFKKTPYCLICKAKITKCLLIKRITKPDKAAHLIFTTDNYMPFNFDHLIPKSRGGPNKASNYGSMCADCNNRKDNLTLEEYFQLWE